MADPKRPGRPRGSSPHGNPAGSEGNPQLLLRLPAGQLAEVRARGGAAWVRQLIATALTTRPQLVQAQDE